MSRNKLIAKYAALDTPDLGERIAEVLNHHISNAGIEELPVLSVIGRWTGRISLVNGGWHDDFELNAPALACLSIDRNARVFPNMDKINGIVEDWRNYLHTETEDDIYLGVDDKSFQDEQYLEDDANDFRSAAYLAEMDSFMKNPDKDMLEHDRALTEIDNICRQSAGEDSCPDDYS